MWPDLRLVVIALDGFPYRLLKECAKDLPNLSKLMESGSWGNLVSTIPFITSTAWTSFITGLNPGKHGVTGFFARRTADPTDIGVLVARNSTSGRSLWSYLSDGGFKVGVFGVPMTYRPESVNGFLISGFPLPGDAKDYTFPDSLRLELEERGWNFADVPTQSYSKDRLEPFFSELKERAKQKTDAVLYLLQNKGAELDFFMVHYFETDKLLHEFLNFRYADKSSREDHARYGNYVDDFFSFIDGQIGRVLEALPPSCNVMVVSDHGLAAGNHLFMTDTFLLKKGHIRIRKRLPSRLRYLAFRLGVTPELGFRVAPGKVSGLLLKSFMSEYWAAESEPEKGRRKGSALNAFLYSMLLDKRRDVDWGSSKVYAFGGYGVASVYVQAGLPEAEAGALRSRVRAELSEATHGKAKIFDRIYFDKEVYVWEGPRHDIPDVLAYDDASEYVATCNPAYFTSNKVVARKYANKNEANHDRNGIFIASGPDFERRGESGELGIADIPVTILHLFGLGVPSNLDGRVSMEMFDRGSDAAKRRPRLVEAAVSQPGTTGFSQTEEAEITSRLRDMGYI